MGSQQPAVATVANSRRASKLTTKLEADVATVRETGSASVFLTGALAFKRLLCSVACLFVRLLVGCRVLWALGNPAISSRRN